MTLRVDREALLMFAQIVDDLRSARMTSGQTQNALSIRLPVRGRAVSEWETGAAHPALAHLIWWSLALDHRLMIIDAHGEPRLGPERKRGEAWEVYERRRLALLLRSRRLACKIPQIELSRRVGVSRDSMQRWESARVPPRPIAYIVWAQKLGCSVVLRPIAAARKPEGQILS